MRDDFEKLLESSRFTKEYLKEHGDSWRYDNESLASFDGFFGGLLSGTPLTLIVDRVRSRKGYVSATNLMGCSRVLRELGIEKGCSVRLKHDNQTTDGIKQVSGSVLSNQTWRIIPGEQDLILCMARGALFHLPGSESLEYHLLNLAYNKLAASGVMLVQVPITEKKAITILIEAAKGIKGLRIIARTQKDPTDKTVYISLGIIRSYGSPTNLPVPSI